MLTVMAKPADLAAFAGQEGKCCHFTIRGYAANARESERSFSQLFGSFNNCIYKEKVEDLLPPITLAEFKLWNCSNCIRVIQTENTLENEVTKGPSSKKTKKISTPKLPLLTSEGANPHRKVTDDDMPIVPVTKLCSPFACCITKDLARDAPLKVCQMSNEGFDSLQEGQRQVIGISACDKIPCKQYQTSEESKLNVADFLRELKKKDSFQVSIALGNSVGRTIMLTENNGNVSKKLAIPDFMGLFEDATKETNNPICMLNKIDCSFKEKDQHLVPKHICRVGIPDHMNGKSSSRLKLRSTVVYNQISDIISAEEGAQVVCNNTPKKAKIVSAKSDAWNFGSLSEYDNLDTSAVPCEKHRKKTQKTRRLTDIFRREEPVVSLIVHSLQVEDPMAIGDIFPSEEMRVEHNSHVRGEQSSGDKTKRRSTISEVDDDESSLMSWLTRMSKKAKDVKLQKEFKSSSSKRCMKTTTASKEQNRKSQNNISAQETCTKVKDKKNNRKNQELDPSDRKKNCRRKTKNSASASSQKHDTSGQYSKEQNQIDSIESEQGLTRINHSNKSLFQPIAHIETEGNVFSRCEILDGTDDYTIADSFGNSCIPSMKNTCQQFSVSKDTDTIRISGRCHSNLKNKIDHNVNKVAAEDDIPVEILRFLQNKQHEHNWCESIIRNLTEKSDMISGVHTRTIPNFQHFDGEGSSSGVYRIMEQNYQHRTKIAEEVSAMTAKSQLWNNSRCRNLESDCGDKQSKENDSFNLNRVLCQIDGQERIQIDESQLLQIANRLQELSVIEHRKKLHTDVGTHSPGKHVYSASYKHTSKRKEDFKYETELLHASKRLQKVTISQLTETSKHSSQIGRCYYPKNHLCRIHFEHSCGRFSGTVSSPVVEQLCHDHSFLLCPSRSFETRVCQKTPPSISGMEILSQDALGKRKRIVESSRGIINTNAAARLLNKKPAVGFGHINESRLENLVSSLVAGNSHNPNLVCPPIFHSNETMSAMNLLKLMDPAVCSTERLYASRDNNHEKLLPCSSFSSNHSHRSVLECGRSSLANGYMQVPTNIAGDRRFHSGNLPRMYTPAPRFGVPAQLFVKENPNNINSRRLPSVSGQPLPVHEYNISCSTVPSSYIGLDRTGPTSPSNGSHCNRRRIPYLQAGARGQSSSHGIPNQHLPMRTEPMQVVAHDANVVARIKQQSLANDIQVCKSSMKMEICVLNMNPADFTDPDENIDFMIRHGELGRRSWLQAKRRRQLVSFWQQQRAANLAM